MERPASTGTTIAAILVVIAVGVAGALVLTNPGITSPLKGGLSDVSSGASDLQAQTSPISISAVSLIADTFDGSEPLSPTCGAASANSYIALVNDGTGSGGVSSVTITFGGSNNDFDVEGSCTIGPSGSSTSTVYVLFPGPNALPNSSTPQASQPSLGTVNLSGGLRLPFSGEFQQGYPEVSISSGSLTASALLAGQDNATCQDSPPSGTGYVELRNTGTEGASVSAVTIGWNGATASPPISGVCGLGAAGTPSASLFVEILGIGTVSPPPKSGEAYTVTVTLTNGAAAPITAQYHGTFG